MLKRGIKLSDHLELERFCTFDRTWITIQIGLMTARFLCQTELARLQSFQPIA